MACFLLNPGVDAMTDIYISASLLALALVARISYAARLVKIGRARFARVDAAGNSPLLSKTTMEATYWTLAPFVRWLVRMHVTANTVTFVSLLLGLSAGAAACADHLGIAAFLAAASALCDAIDGFVARESGSASPAGETFDASADRYNEFFLLGGIALGHHSGRVWLALALLALQGSFMVSYGSARAQGLGVEAPRGSMRRPERAALLTAGCALTPLSQALAAHFFPAAGWLLSELPLAAALFTVSVGANVSAVRRLIRIGQLASEGVTRPQRKPATRLPASQPAIRVAG